MTRALEQFETASSLSPSNGDIGRLIAAIKRRQGKWRESLEEYERVERDRSAKFEYRPRTCLYEHRDAPLAGSGQVGGAPAGDGSGVTRRENSKWLCRLLVEGRYAFDEILARSITSRYRPRWHCHCVPMGSSRCWSADYPAAKNDPCKLAGERGFLHNRRIDSDKSSWKAAPYLAQGDNVKCAEGVRSGETQF